MMLASLSIIYFFFFFTDFRTNLNLVELDLDQKYCQ